MDYWSRKEELKKHAREWYDRMQTEYADKIKRSIEHTIEYAGQPDAARNSIQMAGYAYFSQKEMQNKNTSQVQDMLHEQKGINWNDYPTDCKRGACCKQDANGNWIIDKDIPIFKGQDRDYVEKLVYVGEN